MPKDKKPKYLSPEWWRQYWISEANRLFGGKK